MLFYLYFFNAKSKYICLREIFFLNFSITRTGSLVINLLSIKKMHDETQWTRQNPIGCKLRRTSFVPRWAITRESTDVRLFQPQHEMYTVYRGFATRRKKQNKNIWFTVYSDISFGFSNWIFRYAFVSSQIWLFEFSNCQFHLSTVIRNR